MKLNNSLEECEIQTVKAQHWKVIQVQRRILIKCIQNQGAIKRGSGLLTNHNIRLLDDIEYLSDQNTIKQKIWEE